MRPDSRLFSILALLASLVLPSTAMAAPRRVAVVIGVGSYPTLAPETALPGAAAEAMALARSLTESSGFHQVLPLIDGVATRAGVEGLLFQTLPAQLQPEDLLLVFFAGHGVGADFGEPYLLPSDVDPADVQGTALPVSELARRLRDALPGVKLAILTDAVHDQRMGDLALMGPNAGSWPDLDCEFLALSATGPRELPAHTPFTRLLTDGLAGAADTSGDGLVTSGELVRFVQVQTEAAVGDAAHPIQGGNVGPDLALAQTQRSAEDFPDYHHKDRGPLVRRVGGGLTAAVGIGLGVGSWLLYRDAMDLYPYVVGDASERQAPPEGETYQHLRDRYVRDRWACPATAVAGGVLLATGGTLMVWPAPQGANVGVRFEF
ncbi:MAG: caspase family protein [Pseudomonadota bacterium]